MKRETKRKLAWGGCVIGAALFIAALIWGPWLFEGHHVRDSKLAPSAGIIITGFRTMLVALGAGILAGIGVLYTHRNHQLSQQQFKQTQEQFQLAQQQFRLAQDQFEHSRQQSAHERQKDREAAELAREAQVTERYVAAIKLLASSKVTERLGGIYSLQRILNDSPKDQDTIVKVLSTFAREQDWEKEEQLRKAYSKYQDIGVDVAASESGIRESLGDDVDAARWVINYHRGGEGSVAPHE
ncbi:hypothetical protein OOK39_02220 [Streptomyces sp. NBC_00264]|uniref:hypothetical protein n=1 Tax=unclassified Streptomyces TaxID=2593676 RepID=UPI0022564A13|nr:MULTISPECIES: hypothetical protein [unclassified Streptomyces]MCX5158116.1 hypothetical protein [Streptomyces sp. NBC_00305]MCX5216639.1 hypothetical protein [Streptomyces sp. NBC_00264]